MKYLYFPGCSLKSSGKAYEESMLLVFRYLGIDIEELEDWNCCGATNYMSINEKSALAITARNLALAEVQGGSGEINLVAPCNACYMGLLKAKNYLETEQSLRNKVLEKLSGIGLKYEGRVNILHPLDVLVNHLGLEGIRKAVTKPLDDINVVSYYGCQVVRPITKFDDVNDPVSMDQIAMTLGATAIDWSMKVHCCGGSMTSTVSDVGLRLNYLLLKEAKRKNADVIVTACPLCQFNLECFQGKISKMYGEKINIPVMFFTQLMGIAFGLDKKKLGLQRLFVQPQHI